MKPCCSRDQALSLSLRCTCVPRENRDRALSSAQRFIGLLLTAQQADSASAFVSVLRKQTAYGHIGEKCLESPAACGLTCFSNNHCRHSLV